ncbi:hypothetical protein T03_13630 [Trichinella britovi]|uniref:DUF7041 domain-containing protein n=1 Tax=Trichinella britovi TaxID=45882 RepID=A0A0V1DF46_TRIBR|nr:hypothetical protein T03_13630 [Trichinella britovi]
MPSRRNTNDARNGISSFNAADPELWFLRLDVFFHSDEASKLHMALNVMPDERCITQTKAQRILQAMTNEKLNDDKPSQFLRRIERLLGGASEDVAGQLFLSKVPQSIRTTHSLFQDRIAALQSTAADISSFTSRLERFESLFQKFFQCQDQRVFITVVSATKPESAPHPVRGVTTPALDANGRRVVRNSQPLSVHNRRLLIDNWAAVSLLSAMASQEQQARPARNNLGKEIITVQLADLPALIWTFIVSDVQAAIMGADFLYHHHAMAVGIKRSRLIMAPNNAPASSINGALAIQSTDKYQSCLHDITQAAVKQLESNIISHAIEAVRSLQAPTVNATEATGSQRSIWARHYTAVQQLLGVATAHGTCNVSDNLVRRY